MFSLKKKKEPENLSALVNVTDIADRSGVPAHPLQHVNITLTPSPLYYVRTGRCPAHLSLHCFSVFVWPIFELHPLFVKEKDLIAVFLYQQNMGIDELEESSFQKYAQKALVFELIH